MRDTDYATELASASLGAARVERLLVKETDQEEIRFSWWKDDQMKPRPLDVPEEDLLELFRRGRANGVFSDEFLLDLVRVLLEP